VGHDTVEQAIFIELSRLIIEVMLAVFGFLGYATTIRSFIAKKYGKYCLGLIDGFIMSLVGLAVAFYMQSFF